MKLVDRLPKSVLDATNRLAKDLEWGRRLPIYEYHKWWARRYSGIVRLFLIYNDLEFWRIQGERDADNFVDRLYDNYQLDQKKQLLDLFSGGGTIVFEGSKVGYESHGIELNKVAYWILSSTKSFDLLDSMQGELLNVYEQQSALWETSCDHCEEDAIIVHTFLSWEDDSGNPQVKLNEIKRSRDETTSYFYCEECDSVFESDAETNSCPSCGNPFGKEVDEVVYGSVFPYAEEYYCHNCNDRYVRKITDRNRSTFLDLEKGGDPQLPDIPRLNETQRLLTNGVEQFNEIFSNRQLNSFSKTLDYFQGTEYEDLSKIIVSDSLRSCSYLAQYSPKYRKLTPGFAVKSYWLPTQPVELNPFSFRFTNDGVVFPIGRGNIISAYRRARKANEFAEEEGYDFSRLETYHGAAQDRLDDLSFEADLIFTDPPYADFQYYSDLSLLNLSVVGSNTEFSESVERLKDEEIVARNKDDMDNYLRELGSVFKQARNHLNPDGRMMITYHHTDLDVIIDVLKVFREASFHLKAVYPVVGESSGRLGNGGKKLHLDLLFVFANDSSGDEGVYSVPTDVCENSHDEELVDSIDDIIAEYQNYDG